MTRRTPTTTIDVIGKLDMTSELAIGNYIESKQHNKYIIKPPIWDSAGDTVELNFIFTKREHDAMLMLQKESLEITKRQATANELRTHRLYKTQANLRKKLIEANIFMRECEEKKHQAQKKVIAEERFHEKLYNDIDMFKKTITELTQFRNTLKNTIDEYEPYEDVISDVVNKSDIFESDKDCMDRCDALMLTQVDITKTNSSTLQEIRNMLIRIKKITNDAALTVMGLKNDLAELERSFTIANNRCLYWERIFASAKDKINENELAKESVYEGIRLMYKMLCKRKSVDPVLHRAEVESQMDFIKNEMELLQAVIMKCEHVDTKDLKNSPFSRCT